MDIKLPDNSIGIEPDPIQEFQPEIADALGKVWECAMESEAEILRAATSKPIVLDCLTFKNTTRVRMRLYRCKRLLQNKGNRYVNRLGLSVEGTQITIKVAEDLTKYIVKRDEGDI